jgi:hypothetical protein
MDDSSALRRVLLLSRSKIASEFLQPALELGKAGVGLVGHRCFLCSLKSGIH